MVPLPTRNQGICIEHRLVLHLYTLSSHCFQSLGHSILSSLGSLCLHHLSQQGPFSRPPGAQSAQEGPGFYYLGFILHNWDLICAPLDPVLPLLY